MRVVPVHEDIANVAQSQFKYAPVSNPYVKMFRRDPVGAPPVDLPEVEFSRLSQRDPNPLGEKTLALTALMRKLIVLANQLLKYPDFILAI